MRLGLIGAGRWGKVYIKTLQTMAPRLQLTHLATSRPENKSLAPAAKIFSDWKELLASDCDGVIIAAPSALHVEMTRACLKAGKPVIVEKPLCFEAASAESLQKEADKAKLPVLVNYIHLYNPAYQTVKLAAAASGKPVRAIVSEGTDLGPFRPDAGTLWDRCPHDVALCLDLAGGAAPESVSAMGQFPDKHGRPEMISIKLNWKNGPEAWIHAGRLIPQKRRTLSVLTDTELFHFDEQAAVRCRKIPFDYTGRANLGSSPLPKEGTPLPVPDKPTPMEMMLSVFADQVEGKQPPAGLGFTVELTRILELSEAHLKKKETRCAS